MDGLGIGSVIEIVKKQYKAEMGGNFFGLVLEGSKIIGPNKVEDGVTINAENLCNLLENMFLISTGQKKVKR